MTFMKKDLAAIATTLTLVACGGDDSKAMADAGGDATADATSDAMLGDDASDGGVNNGEASTTYPAFKPPVPQLNLKRGGGFLIAPKIRAIFFPNDPQSAAIDSAMAQYVASSVWTTQLSEYGVGAATWTAATLTDTPPTMIDDAGIQTWLQAKLGGGDAGADAGADPSFGATDAATLTSSIYVVFYPAATSVTVNGSAACGPTAWHDEIAVAGNAVAYAVIPRCSGQLGDLLNVAGYAATSSATDPHPKTAPGWLGYEPGQATWGAARPGEVGNACDGYPLAGDAAAPLRTWSNAAIRGYHDPCIPTFDAAPFFAAVPIMNDSIFVNGQATKGVKVDVGQSKTIDVQLLSDGDTGGKWAVFVTLPNNQSPPAGVFSWDRQTGTNGEILHLTITPKTAMTTAQAFVIKSALGNNTTYWAGAYGP